MLIVMMAGMKCLQEEIIKNGFNLVTFFNSQIIENVKSISFREYRS
jgi:hypothetical protein